MSRKETSGGPNLSRFYKKNKFAKIEGGPMCRCLIWGPNLNLLYGTPIPNMKNFWSTFNNRLKANLPHPTSSEPSPQSSRRRRRRITYERIGIHLFQKLL